MHTRVHNNVYMYTEVIEITSLHITEALLQDSLPLALDFTGSPGWYSVCLVAPEQTFPAKNLEKRWSYCGSPSYPSVPCVYKHHKYHHTTVSSRACSCFIRYVQDVPVSNSSSNFPMTSKASSTALLLETKPRVSELWMGESRRFTWQEPPKNPRVVAWFHACFSF